MRCEPRKMLEHAAGVGSTGRKGMGKHPFFPLNLHHPRAPGDSGAGGTVNPSLGAVLVPLLFAWSGTLPASAADDEPDWRPLFSGEGFPGGKRFTEPAGGTSRTRAAVDAEDLEAGDPAGIFRVRDGEVHVYPGAAHGESVPYGYLATGKARSHYRLRFDFRRGEKKFAPRRALPEDAGVLFHATVPETGPVRGFECEIEGGNGGGLVLLSETQTTTSPTGTSRSPNWRCPRKPPPRPVRSVPPT